jgi:hypothetical protein
VINSGLPAPAAPDLRQRCYSQIFPKEYSTLGVAVMECPLEEINNGIVIMTNKQATPLPVKSWNGVTTISDDVLLRIIAVSKGQKAVAFPPREIRIHCKNYFEFMAANWTGALPSKNDMDALISQGKHIEAADGVKAMVIQCRDLLEANAAKLFPK